MWYSGIALGMILDHGCRDAHATSWNTRVRFDLDTKWADTAEIALTGEIFEPDLEIACQLLLVPFELGSIMWMKMDDEGIRGDGTGDAHHLLDRHLAFE